jgi:hypothetical protein
VLLRVDEHEKRSLLVDCFDKYQDKLKGCFTVITAIASKFGWISLQRVFRPLGFDVPPDIGNASWVPGGA